MTTEASAPQSKSFVTSLLPWVAGAAMFAVFLATLHRWVTPNGLAEVVDISGWSQGQHVFGPVAFLVTYPLRWLPQGWIPLALNLFSALCAALALGLLARSVALLPHDRTYEQRVREQSEFSILTIPAAWMPPLFAVLACGLQTSFWEHATEATGEMFNLLMFAYVIRCLLEYRMDQKESWLVRFALVYGLGMANNWAMVGFFPAFLAALIWIKGVGALNPAFMLRTLACGLAGFLLILLFPILNGLAHIPYGGFWPTLHGLIASEKMIFTTFPRDIILLVSLTSLLPIFVIGIRWASYFGDNSPVGIFLATSMFHIVHALFFIACIWVALDAPVSPRHVGFNLPFLTFYYLGALCIGYFSGYFLLVFGTRAAKSKSSLHPLLRLFNTCVTVCVWLLFVAAPLILARKNLPHLQSNQVIFRAYEQYFTQLEQQLPPKGAVLLSDDTFRLYYLKAAMNRHEKSSPYLFIDTGSLVKDAGYLAFLKKKNPAYQSALVRTNAAAGAPTALGAIQLLNHLAQSHELYYLHPSFGFFFERFYQEPRGLVYRLKTYPATAWDAPPPTRELIAENQAIWKKTFAEALPPLIGILGKPKFPAHRGWWENFLDATHLKMEPDWFALPLGGYYSRALDYWGVELQRAGQVAEAGKCFDQATQMNAGNLSAHINHIFNQELQDGKRLAIQSMEHLEDKFGQHGGWEEVLNAEGPIDEPTFRDELASVLANGGNYRQAVQQLDRVRTLVPNDLRVSLQMAQLFLYMPNYAGGGSQLLPHTDHYAEALRHTELVLQAVPEEPTALFLKSVALIQLKSYDQAIPALNQLLNLQSTNYAARLNRAIAYYKVGNLAAAKPDYEAVGKVVPGAYQVYYGLGEIAYQEKDTPAAIKNYRLYLDNAPVNTAEAKSVNSRLKELKAGAP